MLKVAPSILAADFSKLLMDIKTIEMAEYLHIDVMDGHFVNNISMGPVVYKNLKGKIKMIFDVHLMISDPIKYYQDYIDAGADILTFHIESLNNKEEVIKLIELIKIKNCKVGLSIKPNTSVDEILPYLSNIDLVLVMSVEPGFGGQKFMSNALDKIKQLSDLKKKNQYQYLIEVDGGINYETAKQSYEVGCEIVVAGTYIFNSENRQKTIKDLQRL